MPIAAEDRKRLLDLAHASIAHAVADEPAPDPAPLEGVRAEKRGCFVTLTNRGRLRGCIGTFAPREPLGLTVVRMAGEACRDPRFIHYDPIRAGELPQLTVEVSVLSPLEPIDDPLSLQIGVHGIYIVRGGSAGCFLPEVATDQGWNAEEFLTHCCQGKAGMSGDAWREAGTTVFVFTSEKFSREKW